MLSFSSLLLSPALSHFSSFRFPSFSLLGSFSYCLLLLFFVCHFVFFFLKYLSFFYKVFFFTYFSDLFSLYSSSRLFCFYCQDLLTLSGQPFSHLFISLLCFSNSRHPIISLLYLFPFILPCSGPLSLSCLLRSPLRIQDHP